MDILKHILRGLYSGEGLHLGIYINVEHLLNKTKRPPWFTLREEYTF